MDWFSFSFWADFWQSHALWLMFASAFLSATVLPGNSEIVFMTLAIPKLTLNSVISADILGLVFIATLGNGLGSLTTYAIGRWFPKFEGKNDRTLWVMEKFQRYGSVALLLSWLPVVGDLFCAIAGWLRLNFTASCLFIFLGKLVRYMLLLFLSTPFLL
ncbi:YqaA family protein [Rodentibacter pneumotropicus]|uniref:YqaA family protein n=1 Tax=Rodentibacter pneumotropicus TaxID=758 RepID=UPI00109D129D|nr:YqaA family protein [Rodentibacter pneumotropicus]NBH75836.1 DedA family protein [Rodentibacter pneumotropicus]THA03902.1 DedA family protein [Rodentibacter pneumotropicus]THA13287.1 DedA family protein [Rodentibacter pneumotropicus]